MTATANITATVNGVTLTEAQVEDALKQIEEAKKAAEAAARPPLKCDYSAEGMAFYAAATAVGLPTMVVRACGPYAQRGLFLGYHNKRNWRIVTDSEGATVLTFDPEVR